MQLARFRLPYPKDGPKVTITIRGLIEILHVGNKGADFFLWAVVDLDDFIADKVHLWIYKETEEMDKGEFYAEHLQHLETIQGRLFNIKQPWFEERQSVIHLFVPEAEKRWWAKFGGRDVGTYSVQA